MILRPKQEALVNDIRLSFKQGNRRIVANAATGFGKSVVLGYITSQAVAKGSRVMIQIDTLELVNQLVKTMNAFGLDVGVMQGNHPLWRPSAPVQVCTAQTLGNRFKRSPSQWGPENYPIGMMIVDECHVQWKARDMFADLYPGVPIIGLSASPYARGMGAFYETMVCAPPMQELIDDGLLVPFTVFGPDNPDMSGIATGADGDWTRAGAASVFDTRLHASILETWIKHASDRVTIGFAANVDQSKKFAAEFADAGIIAAHIDGYNTTEEGKELRHQNIEKFKKGEIQVLWNVGVLSKGFDAPIIGALVDAAPTKSLMKFVQRWGRTLRTGGPFEDAIILDHSGNCSRLGFPTDPMPMELDDGETKLADSADRVGEDKEKPKRCGQCDVMIPAGVFVCPNCGVKERKEKKEAVIVDGDLVELKSSNKKKKASDFTQAEKQLWYSGFIFESNLPANQKKPKNWADKNFEKKFGEKPGKDYNRVPAQPTDQVKSWLKSRQIAYNYMMKKIAAKRANA